MVHVFTRKLITALAFAVLSSYALAQTFSWPETYAATAKQGGTIQEVTVGDMTTFNPLLPTSAAEIALLGMITGPRLVYRDWLGTRTFKNDVGDYNLLWADLVEEVRREQEFVITVKRGWKWSDGTEMTVDDIITTARIVADLEVGANSRICSVTAEEEPIRYEKIDTYTMRVVFPKPQVNAIDMICFTLPSHIFGPAYAQGGAAGVQALWGIDATLNDIVSGGPYLLSEFLPGERVAFRKNPFYGEFVEAADGSPLPGPDEWVVTITEDRNAQLARCATGQCSFYYPATLDEVAAMQGALDSGSIEGTLLAELGPNTTTDYLFYNFNNTTICKAQLFRSTAFRQAINFLIDRQALIDAALGGLGFAGYDYQSAAAAPFDAPFLRARPFEFDPERGVQLLNALGFTELAEDGVLMNPDTGCRVDFDIQWNAGNTRRAQEVEIIRQTAIDYGVKINPKEVPSEWWNNAWRGTQLPRAFDFDAQIGALVGGDVDNPSGINVFPVAANLNGWNKSRADAQPWEILLERLSNQMNQELDLEARVEIYNERALLLRQHLPLTPLVSLPFNFYFNMGNVYPLDKMDAKSIEGPYYPGADRALLTTP
jgi:peptide/nickel transport system substrate-binding protein